MTALNARPFVTSIVTARPTLRAQETATAYDVQYAVGLNEPTSGRHYLPGEGPWLSGVDQGEGYFTVVRFGPLGVAVTACNFCYVLLN